MKSSPLGDIQTPFVSINREQNCSTTKHKMLQFFFKIHALKALFKGPKSATYIFWIENDAPLWNFSENPSFWWRYPSLTNQTQPLIINHSHFHFLTLSMLDKLFIYFQILFTFLLRSVKKKYTTKFTRVILGRPCHTITYRSNRLRHLMSFLAASSSPGLSSSTKYSLPLTSSSTPSLLVCFVIGMCTTKNVAKRSVLRSV